MSGLLNGDSMSNCYYSHPSLISHVGFLSLLPVSSSCLFFLSLPLLLLHWMPGIGESFKITCKTGMQSECVHILRYIIRQTKISL